MKLSLIIVFLAGLFAVPALAQTPTATPSPSPQPYNVTLGWDAPNPIAQSGVSAVKLYEKIGVNYNPIATVPQPANEYKITGLAAGSTHTYAATWMTTVGGFESQRSPDLVVNPPPNISPPNLRYTITISFTGGSPSPTP